MNSRHNVDTKQRSEPDPALIIAVASHPAIVNFKLTVILLKENQASMTRSRVFCVRGYHVMNHMENAT
jgi:hypothetical protein